MINRLKPASSRLCHFLFVPNSAGPFDVTHILAQFGERPLAPRRHSLDLPVPHVIALTTMMVQSSTLDCLRILTRKGLCALRYQGTDHQQEGTVISSRLSSVTPNTRNTHTDKI
jgi:hypothetical protein